MTRDQQIKADQDVAAMHLRCAATCRETAAFAAEDRTPFGTGYADKIEEAEYHEARAKIAAERAHESDYLP